MSCGGSMMRAPNQPLAHLVDAVAEKWRAAEKLSVEEQAAVQTEIISSFNIGEKPELTFHGGRFLLTVSRLADGKLSVDIHEITQTG